MNRSLFAIVLGVFSLPVLAQSTPVGSWRSIDDQTGEAKAEIRIMERAGVLNGRNDTLRLTPIEGGRRLEVRGSIFGIGRTQTWVRIP